MQEWIHRNGCASSFSHLPTLSTVTRILRAYAVHAFFYSSPHKNHAHNTIPLPFSFHYMAFGDKCEKKGGKRKQSASPSTPGSKGPASCSSSFHSLRSYFSRLQLLSPVSWRKLTHLGVRTSKQSWLPEWMRALAAWHTLPPINPRTAIDLPWPSASFSPPCSRSRPSVMCVNWCPSGPGG